MGLHLWVYMRLCVYGFSSSSIVYMPMCGMGLYGGTSLMLVTVPVWRACVCPQRRMVADRGADGSTDHPKAVGNRKHAGTAPTVQARQGRAGAWRGGAHISYNLGLPPGGPTRQQRNARGARRR